jgi:hypothetical protein
MPTLFTLDFRNDRMYGVVSRQPDNISKWALLIFLGCFSLLVSAAWVVRYPGIVKGKAASIDFDASDNSLYLKISSEKNAFRKVNFGQNVRLYFDACPGSECGFVAGKVRSVPDILSDTVFKVRVYLPEGLTTTRNKFILYNPGIHADVLIAIDSMRLLQRLFYDPGKPAVR